MKTHNKFLYTLSIVGTLVACSAPSNEDKLAELKSKAADLNKEISELETLIAKSDTTKKDAGLKVGVSKIENSTFVHNIEVQGKIDSDKNVRLSSTIGGTVDQIYVSKGQSVAKGALLLRTDGDQILKALDEVNNALDLANQLYDKQKRLWDQKIGTEVQYLQAKNQKEGLEKKKASIETQYENTKIRAPYAGVIDEVYAKVGEMLPPGVPALRIVNSNELKLVANVSESYVSNIKAGQPVEVYFPDLKKTIQSKVYVVGDVIDPVNRTITIEMALAQDKNAYKANMIAYIKIKDYQKASSIAIPVNVVQRNGNENYVYVAVGNKTVKKNIVLGKVYKNQIEVLSGLSIGDMLITVGYQDLVDGQLISY